jgi:hypothetical protein
VDRFRYAKVERAIADHEVHALFSPRPVFLGRNHQYVVQDVQFVQVSLARFAEMLVTFSGKCHRTRVIDEDA